MIVAIYKDGGAFLTRGSYGDYADIQEEYGDRKSGEYIIKYLGDFTSNKKTPFATALDSNIVIMYDTKIENLYTMPTANKKKNEVKGQG